MPTQWSLILAAFVPQYGLGWEVGPQKLTIVSIGAGTFRARIDSRSLSGSSSYS